MRTFYGILVACLLWATGQAQGYNPEYGTTVTIIYGAPKGRTPAEVKIMPPAYPFELRRAGINGEVSFELTVEEEGTVTGCVVTKASNLEFRRSAEEALATWKFNKRRAGMNESPRPLLLVGKVRFSVVDE